jgi:hypothetical protein
MPVEAADNAPTVMDAGVDGSTSCEQAVLGSDKYVQKMPTCSSMYSLSNQIHKCVTARLEEAVEITIHA